MKRKSGKYVDGYVLPVPKKKLAAYRRMAREAGKIWRKHGALEYKECVGEDLRKTKWSVSFTKTMKAKPSETIVFAYIVFKSRAHRDQVNKKVMAEMHKHAEKHKDVPMPFDVKRMAYGGFKVIVD